MWLVCESGKYLTLIYDLTNLTRSSRRNSANCAAEDSSSLLFPQLIPTPIQAERALSCFVTRRYFHTEGESERRIYANFDGTMVRWHARQEQYKSGKFVLCV